jgi:hypothetical protein
MTHTRISSNSCRKTIWYPLEVKSPVVFRFENRFIEQIFETGIKPN